jgi:hypothetical protein
MENAKWKMGKTVSGAGAPFQFSILHFPFSIRLCRPD